MCAPHLCLAPHDSLILMCISLTSPVGCLTVLKLVSWLQQLVEVVSYSNQLLHAVRHDGGAGHYGLGWAAAAHPGFCRANVTTAESCLRRASGEVIRGH